MIYKKIKYRVGGCACLDGYTSQDCDDIIYDKDKVPVPDAVISAAGDCPTEVVVVCSGDTSCARTPLGVVNSWVN